MTKWIIHYHGKNSITKWNTIPTKNQELIYELINQIGQSDSLVFDKIEMME